MSKPVQAIFLSYASQDADAAARICNALRAGGLEVWFDQSELRGGDAWDASIRRQIRECALFVPLISANTDERSEGYFRLEWKLAVDRSHLIADDRSFLLPVLIDNTTEATARVPDRFRERQWTRLLGGDAPPEFVERVRQLLAGLSALAPAPAPATPVSQVASGATKSRAGNTPTRRPRAWLLGGVAVAAAAIAVAVVVWNDRAPREVAVPKVAIAEPPAADRKSVAVLPFQNLSGRPEDAYLADGMQEEILNALARFHDLKVISRSSVMEFRDKRPDVREIGRRLGVGSLLEGSIRRDGNTLRLTVQLIDVKEDRHVLATNYDREIRNSLDLQSTVARLVADALAATLSRRERGELDRIVTNSGDAYDRYLRAVAVFKNPLVSDYRRLDEPKRLLEEAVRIDPDFAEAHALLSRVNTFQYFYAEQPLDGTASKRAYERALALQPDLPEAKLARGMYTLYVAKEPERALIDLADVVQLRPSNAEAHQLMAFALRRRGRFDEALGHQTLAWEIDPLNEAYAVNALTTLTGLRRLPEAIELTKLHAQRFPKDPRSHFVRARIESLQQGSPEPLRVALREYGGLLEPDERNAIGAELARAEGRYLDAARIWEKQPRWDDLDRGLRIGLLYGMAGDRASAERMFLEAERFARGLMQREPGQVDLRDLAIVQSLLGKHAEALATIENAQKRFPEARNATNGPSVSFVRSVILVRAGRSDEGYAEVARLLRVPFSAPIDFSEDAPPIRLMVKDDPHFDELLNRPPRL